MFNKKKIDKNIYSSIIAVERFITANPLYNGIQYNSKIFIKNHFDVHEMTLLFLICTHYNSKFSLRSKYLGTSDVVVKRVHFKLEFIIVLTCD